jgi:hypothetical protein
MTLSSLPLYLTSLGVLSFGIFVLARRSSQKLGQFFFLCAISTAVWSFGYGLLFSTRDPEKAIHFARIGYIGVVFMPTTIFQFVFEFIQERHKRFIALCYCTSLAFLLVSRFDLFLHGVYHYKWGLYPKAGPLYWVFILFFYIGWGTCIYYLFRRYLEMRKEASAVVKRNQIKYVLFAFTVGFISFSDFLPNYHIDVYPCAYLAASGWLVIMAYGTLRHRVIDVNLIIRRTLIYSTVMVILGAGYLAIISVFAKMFQGLTGSQTIVSSSIAAGIVTLCFQPLRNKIRTLIDTKFFREYVDRDEKLYELSREVITHTTPEAMAEALMRVLGETLHPKVGALYLRARARPGYVPAAKWGECSLERMEEDNPLTRYFADHPQPFVQDAPAEVATPRSTRNVTPKSRSET